MTENFNWRCPFCDHSQVATERNVSEGFHGLYIGENRYGSVGFYWVAIACLNEECKEVFLKITFAERNSDQFRNAVGGDVIQPYTLRPEFLAKTFPDYIPSALRQDYIEACRIRDASPKASATLARRCIQGVIRDFCKVSKATLNAEIETLNKLIDEGNVPAGVTAESVEAIDHVRRIGNIGAHMEKDISTIVDIDEGEAQALIELIELLFDEWYVARDTRSRRLARVKQIREDKDAQRKLPPP